MTRMDVTYFRGGVGVYSVKKPRDVMKSWTVTDLSKKYPVSMGGHYLFLLDDLPQKVVGSSLIWKKTSLSRK